MWKESKIISKNIKNNPIGFFDSGVGGLTVLKQFRELLPYEDCLYFGDTKNMPYGEKSKTELIKISNKIFKFFEEKNVKAVVMACNTTSSNVYDTLKNNYNFKIYPIIQSVTGILANLPVTRLGVFATHATINSHAYSQGINRKNKKMEVIEIACPDWVRIVENKTETKLESIEKIKSRMDEMLLCSPEKIVLGCTHYPYLINQLERYVPREMLINPAEYFVKFIKKDLVENNILSDKTTGGYEKFFVSANPEQFKTAGSMFYEVKTTPELIIL